MKYKLYIHIIIFTSYLQEADEVQFNSYARIEHVITGYWLHALRGITENIPYIVIPYYYMYNYPKSDVT